MAHPVFLQETHSGLTDETLWTCEWEGKIVFAHGNKSVAILFKYSLKFEMGTVKSTFTINIDSEGRFMLVEVKINSKTFVMESVYAPVIDKPKFLDSLFSALLILLIMI